MSCDTTVDCPICMDAIHANINCVITECGHTFHTRCLLTNIVHNGFGCPYCRTEMVPEELLKNDDEEEPEQDEMNQAFIIEDDEDEEGRENRNNWLTAAMDNGVTIRRRQMNRLRMYERAHSTMRMMFARLEDENAEPEDVDFEDYNTIHSDNYSFDEEDDEDEDYETESISISSESDSDSDDSENNSEPALVVDEEASRAFANHLPNVNQVAYALERAEYTVSDFTRILLREYPQYSSIIDSNRVRSSHRTINRLVDRIISSYQDRIYQTQPVVPAADDNDEYTQEETSGDQEEDEFTNAEDLVTIARRTEEIILDLD